MRKKKLVQSLARQENFYVFWKTITEKSIQL